ncbi:MAG: TolC family protein [Burkholderiaceae bacterium]|jgi:outer membrane protein TolC|nr:TolC family protein [Burkholderiaceae bacterium]MEB2352083.1 TolC family protein [Burkholderiaceae bacterium]
MRRSPKAIGRTVPAPAWFATVWLLAVVPMAVTAARAQSLADAVEQAWLRSPLAAPLAALDDVARARADLAARLVSGPPSASLSASSDRFHGDDGVQKLEAQVGVPLWLPGQQAARRAEAESQRAVATEQRSMLRWTLAGTVRTQWWSLAIARATRELATRRVDSARRLESDVRRRYDAGELARMDANLARDERLAAEADEARAQASVQSREAELRATTGAAAPTILAAEPDAAQPWRLEDHPQWRAANAAVQSAHAGLLATVKSDRAAPTVALRFERDRGGRTEPFANVIGVEVSIPFFWEPQVQLQTAGARGELARAQAAAAAARLRLQAAVDGARAEHEAAARQLDIARERLAATADNLGLAERSFALGETDLASLLRVRAAALEAERLLTTQRIALDAARSQLNQALGIVP